MAEIDSYPRQQLATQVDKNRQVLSSIEEREIVRIGVGGGCEQAISRILSPSYFAIKRGAIIYLERQLPGVSSDQPGG